MPRLFHADFLSQSPGNSRPYVIFTHLCVNFTRPSDTLDLCHLRAMTQKNAFKAGRTRRDAWPFDTGLLCWGLLCLIESGRRLALCCLLFTALAVYGALAKSSLLIAGGLSGVLLAGEFGTRANRRLAVGMIAGFGAGIDDSPGCCQLWSPCRLKPCL